LAGLGTFYLAPTGREGQGRERQNLDDVPAFLAQRFRLFGADLDRFQARRTARHIHRLRHLRKNLLVLARENAPQYRSPACAPGSSASTPRCSCDTASHRDQSLTVPVVLALGVPWKFAPSPSSEPSLRRKPFGDAPASVSVPATVKCSSDRCGSASFRTRPKKFPGWRALAARSRCARRARRDRYDFRRAG
jgi:hypothetical protein